MRDTKRLGRGTLLVALAASWLGGAGAGLAKLEAYSAAPSAQGAAPPSWPEGSALDRPRVRPLLLMAVHPKCACSKASLAQLAALLTRARGLLSATVLFVRPEGVEPGWEETELWATAQAIDGLQAFVDRGGREARRFGAETSGQVLLYDARGALAFQGGITARRGHQGDTGALSALESLVEARITSETVVTAPVFGCALREKDE